MSALTAQLPSRRAELVIRPLGARGQYVVKDPSGSRYFELGEEEHFLLLQLDGQCRTSDVCAAFERRFGQPLSEQEFASFLDLAASQSLLERETTPSDFRAKNPQPTGSPPPKQSILYWRRSIVNPDRFFDWLAPRISFFWTRGFFLFSAACIVLATLVLWTRRAELAASFVHALRWDTALWAWLTLLTVTTLHEFAHGLTCTHHGGEVREIGFLLMFFMPCFYCNVSDAWLFREKSKRLWVTFAGGYFELFLWSLAVFAWRITLPGSLPNRIAFVVAVSSGVSTLFNFNPLIKLDGYYLLSDGLEIPNLQQRGFDRFKALLRHGIWGAPRPEATPQSRTLAAYGLVSWLYSLVFLFAVLWGMFWFLGGKWGVAGMGMVALLGVISARPLMRGVSSGEFSQMITRRHRRLAGWLVIFAGAGSALALFKIDDRASGKFVVRPAVRAELRAPAAGFLRDVYVDEGDRVEQGATVARLEISDLDSRLAQRRAQAREIAARLQQLESGPRQIELDQLADGVERAKAWRDLARRDLEKMQRVWSDDMARLETVVAASEAELEVAKDHYERARTLVNQKTLPVAEFHETRGRYRVGLARLERARAEKRARQSTGVLEAETEQARREKELAEAEAALKLLEAGTRPEEIEAERARLARVEADVCYLERLRTRLTIAAPFAGTITTARLKERSGQYVREGDLICLVEAPGTIEVEISLPEQEAARVLPNQLVRLKARAQPFKTFETQVSRLAPAAAAGEVQSHVAVYCLLDDQAAELKSGMTGQARISTGRRPVGAILLHRVLRFIRTEFWW
jgi:multidrug efflux pump subunit AcrA (membrane-fusion protein)